LPEKPSIAVLYFANQSGDPQQDYFADGIVHDIITGLCRHGSACVDRALRSQLRRFAELGYPIGRMQFSFRPEADEQHPRMAMGASALMQSWRDGGAL
jgi:hypothetical protein